MYRYKLHYYYCQHYHVQSYTVIHCFRLHCPLPNYYNVFFSFFFSPLCNRYAPILSDVQYLNNNMDIMLTYSLRDIYPRSTVANLPVSYFPLNLVSPQAVLHPARPFAQKTGWGGINTAVGPGGAAEVAMFVSNCRAAGAEQRAKYLEELMRYIPVS